MSVFRKKLTQLEVEAAAAAQSNMELRRVTAYPVLEVVRADLITDYFDGYEYFSNVLTNGELEIFRRGAAKPAALYGRNGWTRVTVIDVPPSVPLPELVQCRTQ